MNMNDEELFKNFVSERNLTYGTEKGYKYVLKTYVDFTEKSLQELLTEAETEEDNGIRWKKRKLKKRLIAFRSYLFENYLGKTAKTHFGKVLTFYKHFEIEIHDLPQISKKNINQNPPINYKDLPTKEDIKNSLKYANPVMRAVILFMSSSGCARRETLNITIQDFIDATKEYHNSNNIYDVLNELKDNDSIIPTFKIHRQKTNKHYYTFCSPEATTEIFYYLSNIDKELKNEDKLFKIGQYYFYKSFNDINDALALGKIGDYSSFRSHMLRKFHASQLYNSGMSRDEVDALQGRSKNSTHKSYFMENPEKLKLKYMEHMDSVTINLDINNLDIKSPEYIKLETEILKKDEKIENYEKLIYDIDERLRNIEKKEENFKENDFENLLI